ncbi:MAG: polysaccharide ABC transporter ATP-binding protein [Akkermansiaceae bacterium]
MSSETASKIEQSQPEVLVKVENAGKVFCRDLKKSLFYGLKDSLRDLLCFSHREEINSNNRQLRSGEFWANKDISFELRRGECLGLIGHNGAGKTTLLKMLNGLIKPDAGKIEMRGRVGALIALGAGFNPILTGRENIYINGSVLGFSKKEIDEQIDEIITFSDIEKFIDAPVQTYSSGMQVRLGFSIASSLKPDILILDEVLAVGDMSFVIKCLNRVRELAANSAVIFVSHNMQLVSSFCNRLIVMSEGSCTVDTNDFGVGIGEYLSLIKSEVTNAGNGQAEIKAIYLRNDKQPGVDVSEVEQGSSCFLDVEVDVKKPSTTAKLSVYIMDETSTPIIHLPLVDAEGSPCFISDGVSNIRVALGAMDLCAGNYSFTCLVTSSENDIVMARTQGLSAFRVLAGDLNWGKIVRPVIPCIERQVS